CILNGIVLLGHIKGIGLIRRVNTEMLGRCLLIFIICTLVGRGLAPIFELLNQYRLEAIGFKGTGGCKANIASSVKLLMKIDQLLTFECLGSSDGLFKGGHVANVILGPMTEMTGQLLTGDSHGFGLGIID